MYLGKANISALSTFLTGYSIGHGFAKGTDEDEYFGENGFMDWYYKKYKVK